MIFAEKYLDKFECTKNAITLTQEQHHIPGVTTFAHRLNLQAGDPIVWHYHENSFEFSMLSEGTFSFSTLENSYTFSGSEIFISYPNEIHGSNQVPRYPSDLYWFQLNISDKNNFLFLKPETAQKMIAELNSIPQRIIKDTSGEMIKLVIKAFEFAKEGADTRLTASFLQLFLNLVIVSAQEYSAQISPDIHMVTEYIKKNITSEISLEELASIIGLSCSSFKQKFKKQLGISPRHYINQQKIDYAKILLLEGKSITEVAMTLNFTTCSYFTTVFKKYTYYTPYEYIKKFINQKPFTKS